MRAPNHCGIPLASRQSGAVLVVAIVLLLLAGVMTLLALNVGIFEQRTTANDLRAKMVHEVGEASINQGAEFLLRQHPEWITDTGRWTACGPDEVAFPCGAVEKFQPDGVTHRRANYFRLGSYTNNIPDIDAQLSQYMLPLTTKIASVGNGESVAYGVAPLLCRAERPGPADPVDAPIRCGDGTGPLATPAAIVTFVGVAKMPNEAARTTLVQTLGTYPVLADLMGKPPLTTSGSADVTGGLQIVTNPNAAGPGVPVSVWTRRDINKTGTPNTCYADEFFRYTKNNVTPTLTPASCPAGEPNCQTIRCDECQCDVNGSPGTLSYDSSGNLQDEGIDILDVEGNSTQVGTGTNHNVRSDSLSYPKCEFPPDPFKFVFGVDTWRDDNGDCFGETKIMTQYVNPNTGQLVPMGADEAWLFSNAKKVIPAADAAHTYSGVLSSALLRPGQSATAAYLDASASGIIWCQTNCNIGANQEVGSPMAPVVLVLDGPVTIQGVVWGFVFVRSTGTTLNATSGNSVAGNCPNNCMVQMNAGAAIYGAMVVQGQMKANGTSAVIYDAKVLAKAEQQGPTNYATLPGAWNDRRSY